MILFSAALENDSLSLCKTKITGIAGVNGVLSLSLAKLILIENSVSLVLLIIANAAAPAAVAFSTFSLNVKSPRLTTASLPVIVFPAYSSALPTPESPV